LKNTNDRFGKFEEKLDEGIFPGYSMSSKAYRVFNKKTQFVEESINVKFQDYVHNLLYQIQLEESEPVPDLIKFISPEEV